MTDLYFRCDDCGGRIRPFDGRNYKPSEDKKELPLRAILHNQMEIAGRQMCRKCCKRYLAGVMLFGPGPGKLIMP